MTNPLLRTTEPGWPLDRDEEVRRRARFESLTASRERTQRFLRRLVPFAR